MTWRKVALLMIGILGSSLAATCLYISAESIRQTEVCPSDSTIPSIHLEESISGRKITLPVGVPGTALIAQRLSAYDGPFLEDGSDREVIGVAALLVYNGGCRELEKAEITLQYPEADYVFVGNHIPAGGMVVLLEKNAKAYRGDAPTAVAGSQTLSAGFNGPIAVTEGSGGELTVYNLGDKTLKNVCIYYKAWLSPPDIYVGGISYSVHLPSIQPGQRCCVYPEHYAAGFSKIVSVRAEEN